MLKPMDNRPPVYTEGDRIIYRASIFGLPLRSLVAARLGYEQYAPPPIVREAGQEGTRLEHVIKQALDLKVIDDQREVEFHHGAVIVRGHIDGCVAGRGKSGIHSMLWRLLEVKTVTQAGLETWMAKRWAARPSWAWQVSVYCQGLELADVLMAVQARDTGELDRWEAPAPYQAHHLRERIDAVEHWVGMEMLPPAESYSGWDPWAHLHRLESVRDDSLAEALREYVALQEDEKLLAAQKAAAKQSIVFLMGDRQKVCAEGLEATRSRNGSLTVVAV